MDSKASTSSYGQLDSERGAGGKLKKPPARKSQSTPYDRPSSSQNGSRWWLSKIVDSGYRLAAGATKIFPALLSTTPSVAALPPATNNADEHDLEGSPVPESNERDISNVSMPHFAERTGPSDVDESGKSGQDVPNGKENEPQLSGIEQLIKGKTFTRDEISKLMEILNSRVSEVSDVEDGKKKEILTPVGVNAGGLTSPFSKPSSDEVQQKSLNKAVLTSPKPGSETVQDEIVASPVAIARAYMGSRLSEYGPGPIGVSSERETAQKVEDRFALKPFIPSPAPRSTCWPGSMAHEQHGYATPNQRGRQGLHDFARTPYSRTIYSKSRAKLSQVQTDSKYLISSPNNFKHFRTPIPEQVKYRNDVLDDSYGSAGPIRRLRARYASEVRPRGSIFSKDSKEVYSVGKQSIVHLENQSNVQKNLQLGETSSSQPPPIHLESKAGDKSLLNPSTNEAVKRILDQLDKHKPTPQEKLNELKLAGAWRKSHTGTSATPKGNLSFPFSEETTKRNNFNGFDLTPKGNISADHSKNQGGLPDSNVEAKETLSAIGESLSRDYGSSVMRSNVKTGFWPPFKSTPAEPKSLEERAGQSIAPKHQNYEQLVSTSTDDSKVDPLKKPPLHSFGTKPNLPNISVNRRAPGFSMSSDSGTGFSFPVTTTPSTVSEPPTPSVMPFSLGGPATQTKDSPAIPTYNFGSNNSSRLVFSFPSSSSTPSHVDANDLKFNFGSDKKPRVSFASVGKDAVCY